MNNNLLSTAVISDKELKAVFRLEVKNRADKMINFFLLGYFLLGLVFAAFYDTWTIAFVTGALSLLAYYSAKIALPDSGLYQYILSIIFAIFMAQYIYQMHGMFEMHFFAFIGSAILIVYQNWKLQIPMLVVVIIHHVTFGYLQNTGVENIYFTQLDSFELRAFIIHFVLAAIIFFVCGLWGWQLKKYREKQIDQTIETGRLQKETLEQLNAQKQQEEQLRAEQVLAENNKKFEQERHAAMIDKAVAQGKFEIASDVMHDIGNAVVGFGSYLTRIQRLQSDSSQENLRNLAGYFEKQKQVISTVIGEAKASAVVQMLDAMSQTQKSNREEISQSVAEQLNIITNIQEILAIQRQYITGHESQERKAVNLPAVIHDAISMVTSSLEDIEVAIDIPADLPVIKGDRTKLMQVFLNLIKNSIEAIGKEAVQKTISITASTCNGSLLLMVKDSGHGFDKSASANLFSRGFTTKPSRGGLGLYNCKAIIESHDGSIHLTSDGYGKGALATIRI
ncbi:MAG: HAMP domain-containing sensor histidine kinase [Chitinophagaceae bacterium]